MTFVIYGVGATRKRASYPNPLAALMFALTWRGMGADHFAEIVPADILH